VADYPYLGAMVDRLVAEHGLDRDELIRVFDRVKLRPQVVEAIKKPAERLPWHRYRSFFINAGQIRNGIRFWEANGRALARAERETGVPQEIIAAVIGIETRYGATLGSHSVLESLTTLTLQYPRRREFFGEQLEHFLILTHEQNLDRFSIRGSYAGAIGIPQFMPTSYRQYAVDFSGDGKTDLVNQIDDAIGSVANYLKQFKWRAGEPVSLDLVVDDGVDKAPLTSERRLDTTVGRLRGAGARIDGRIPDDMKAGVVSLDGEDGTLYRVVFHNFYVLTRYNPSVLYAMAVHELSSALKRDYHGS
jgi:membrane-bound lytic murein transglycosylase B